MRWRAMLTALAAAVLPYGAAAETDAVNADIPALRHAPLTPAALRAHIERLASDEFEGRAPTTHGETLTLDYISRAFAAAGLAPGGDRNGEGGRDWRQRVPLMASTATNQPALAVSGPDGARAYAFEYDQVVWTKRRVRRTGFERAELVFVGYGVVAPLLGWNDYAGVDMRGKVAVILANDPDTETGDDRGFRGAETTYYGRWSTKVEEAARQGAVGALVVHEDGPAGFAWSVVRSGWSGPQFDIARDGASPQRPAVEGWLRRDVAANLFARAGFDLTTEKARAQRPDFTARRLGLVASIDVENEVRDLASYNVVGVLGGGARHDEAVVYTAHWDHLGRCPPINGDHICNGALDNASGVAGLIELARRFGESERTQRTILFVATTAEEAGFLGAQHYVRHANVPPARMAGAINLDVLNSAGPARDIAIVGEGQNDLELLLAEAAQRHGRVIGPEPDPSRQYFFRSDHLPFAEAGVPVLFPKGGFDLAEGGVTRGRARFEEYLAERYHKPADEITSDWDLSGAFQDLLLLYEVGERLGNSGAWPDWRGNSAFRPIRDATRRARE